MDAITTDTLAAIGRRWDATDGLPDAFPAGLHSDKRPALAGASYPYAVVLVSTAREPEYSTADNQGRTGFVDYRRVEIEIYGVGKAEVGSLVGRARAAFANAPLELETGTWLRTWVTGEEIPREPQTRHGEQIYRGVLELEVWSSRVDPQ